MPNEFPFAVRLIGFPEPEALTFETIFADEQGRGYGYFRLQDDDLQDPDLYLVNADEIKALATLTALRPSAIRPALLVGAPHVSLPYPCVQRPIPWHTLFEELDTLIEKRADALSKLEASDIISVPERRRRDRIDLDLTDPSTYRGMRRVLAKGNLLVVDKAPALRDYLQDVLIQYKILVELVATEHDALKVCTKNKIAAVLINTSTPDIDPYHLCESIKKNHPVEKASVIFLIGKQYPFDAARARAAGYDGFLNKPLAYHHLLSAVKKFLPTSR